MGSPGKRVASTHPLLEILKMPLASIFDHPPLWIFEFALLTNDDDEEGSQVCLREVPDVTSLGEWRLRQYVSGMSRKWREGYHFCSCLHARLPQTVVAAHQLFGAFVPFNLETWQIVTIRRRGTNVIGAVWEVAFDPPLADGTANAAGLQRVGQQISGRVGHVSRTPS